jgi:hypothetical protein
MSVQLAGHLPFLSATGGAPGHTAAGRAGWAARADVPLILTFIRALADYERLSDEVEATAERLQTGGEYDRRIAEMLRQLLAERDAAVARVAMLEAARGALGITKDVSLFVGESPFLNAATGIDGEASRVCSTPFGPATSVSAGGCPALA